MEWAFHPTHGLLDSVIRGTLVFLGLYALLRMVNNRRAGSIRLSDLLFVTLLSSAVQNAMVRQGKSLTEGAVTTVTLFFWSYLVDWLAFRFPRLNLVDSV